MTFIEEDLVTYRKHSFESGNRVCEDTGWDNLLNSVKVVIIYWEDTTLGYYLLQLDPEKTTGLAK